MLCELGKGSRKWRFALDWALSESGSDSLLPRRWEKCSEVKPAAAHISWERVTFGIVWLGQFSCVQTWLHSGLVFVLVYHSHREALCDVDVLGSCLCLTEEYHDLAVSSGTPSTNTNSHLLVLGQLLVGSCLLFFAYLNNCNSPAMEASLKGFISVNLSFPHFQNRDFNSISHIEILRGFDKMLYIKYSASVIIGRW